MNCGANGGQINSVVVGRSVHRDHRDVGCGPFDFAGQGSTKSPRPQRRNSGWARVNELNVMTMGSEPDSGRRADDSRAHDVDAQHLSLSLRAVRRKH
jgi:hypothetical protein